MLGGNNMHFHKSILTGVVALSLFATSAAAVVSAINPVVSNASEKKQTKYVKYLSVVKSKGHATKYFCNDVYFDKKIGQLKNPKYNWWLGNAIDGYKRTNDATYYKLIGNHMYRIGNTINTYYSKSNKPINTSEVGDALGGNNISKKTFNKLKSQYVVKGSVKAPKKYAYAVKTLNIVKSKGYPTKYFYMVANYDGTKAELEKGSFCWYRPIDQSVFGFSNDGKTVYYYLKGNRMVRRNNHISVYYKKKNKAITNYDMEIITGTCRFNGYQAKIISKAEFNKIYKQQTK